MADDDPDDRLLAQDALSECKLANDLRFVENGEQLLDYLHRRGNFANGNAPRPGLILLDLNMPRKDGRDALREIKLDPELRRIPVIVLTTLLSLRVRARVALVPILSFPILMPQLIACTQGAAAALSGDASAALGWSGILAAFALVYRVLGLTIVPAAIE